MNLTNYSTVKLAEQIKQIVAKNLDLSKYELFFFGSRTNQKANDRSDIDIGIKGKNSVPYEIMSKIKEKIDDLPLLYKVDFVDFSQVSDEFAKLALSTKIVIK